jgi:prepilin-type N-terminal cleavage/methylation domain-containing protein
MKAPGYSLIELIIVIVVLAIAVVGIGSALAYLSRSQRLGVELQAATQIAQECAAHIMGRGRRPGSYAGVPVASPSTFCNGLPAVPAGYTRVVNITTMPAGGALCSAGWACKRVEILVSASGATLVALNFMLVNY